MDCACCNGTVPQDAQSCPHCGAVEYRGLGALSPGRPALWVGSISGFLLGVLAGHGNVLMHLMTGALCALVAIPVCGVLAWMSFPGRTPMTCKHCGGTVAPDAQCCPHCNATSFGDTPDMNRILMWLGVVLGAIAGFAGGILTSAPGVLAHAQGALVLMIVGAYAGAIVFLSRLPKFLFFLFQILGPS
jgi:RNA polymerase subunit RPABC4/transcription elongation factor Spt4